jgi:hypothetical protein
MTNLPLKWSLLNPCDVEPVNRFVVNSSLVTGISSF